MKEQKTIKLSSDIAKKTPTYQFVMDMIVNAIATNNKSTLRNIRFEQHLNAHKRSLRRIKQLEREVKELKAGGIT